MDMPSIIVALSAAMVAGLGSFGCGIGQGIASNGALNQSTRQRMAMLPINNLLLLGLALIESANLFAFLYALRILFSSLHSSLEQSLVIFSAALAVGTSCLCASIAAGKVVAAATGAIARQPFFCATLRPFMLLSQAIIETPVIFSFVIALMLESKLNAISTFLQAVQCSAAGFIMAVGSIGVAFAQGVFGSTACQALGRNNKTYKQVFSFSIVSQAIIETPIIFCLLFSLMIMYDAILPTISLHTVVAAWSAIIALSIGSISASSALGRVFAQGCSRIAVTNANITEISKAAFFAVTFIESVLIYVVIVGLFLLLRWM